MNDNKTFTQDEVNAIISERLKQERAKIMKETQEKEAELNRREAMMNTRADWQKRGLPVDLLECLDTEKLDAAAAILEGINKNSKGQKGGFDRSNSHLPHRNDSEDDQKGPTEKAIRKSMGLERKDE